MQSLIKKIVVLGPESTGKSTLCKQLADHYNVSWVPEFARSWLLQNGTNYSYADLLEIAHGQLALEDQMASTASNAMLIIDTDMNVMKVWCEFVFAKCHQWILDQIASRKYDLYLLCKNDLPWIKDELREYPDPNTRDRLFKFYKDIMVNQDVPWVLIEGNYEERLNKAINAIDTQIIKKLP